ncbi:helix-turn-helix transcriptional regulator [Coralloluteibacterium thermophilus]|uniref:Helix-turn-helix transcriptional regulator n=1 Tax=Coralloluteibacterium thermophilum TaxID=2707049 RepID=A0ABV9NI59_9GAMM
MLSTSARLLRLVSLLQSRRHWPGRALADRLGIDPRTLRRDIERLRELGYPVQASAGVGGGYALGRGADLPPLALDDEEAVALAMALRAATATIGGMEDTALRLLAKLDQMLPTRLRRRASALHGVTLSVRMGEALVDSGVLTALATACRDRRVVRFGYRSHDGTGSARIAEPLRLANYGRRWYLVARDRNRDDWRTFRVDRIDGLAETGECCPPCSEPTAEVAARIEEGIAYAPFPCRATLRLRGRAERLAAEIPAWCGVLEPEDEAHCLLRVGAETPDALLAQIAFIGREAELVEGHQHLDALRAAADRLQALLADAPPARAAGRLRPRAAPARPR